MHTRRLSNATSVVLLATLASVLLAACGDSPKPSPSASTGNSSAARSLKGMAADAYKQSACMRAHGVKSFPDPTVVSNAHQQMIGIHITPAITSSPSFKSAQKACAHLMPQGGNNTVGPSATQQRAHTEGILAFSACMRTRGFKSFPDPDNQGNLTPAMLQRANINLQQPAVKPAADACAGASHGQITKADINQAIANPGGNGG
jgi:hypothetical protein